MKAIITCIMVIITICPTFAADMTIADVKLVPSQGGEYEHFGYSISMDGAYVIIGAPDPMPEENVGSAFVYKHEGQKLIERTRLTRSGGKGGDLFGHSVAISGDYAVVGVPGHDIRPLIDNGSAFVYRREGEHWIEQVMLVADDHGGGDEFGYSVGIDGDYLIVGAPLDDPAGSAYIFKRNGEIWEEQAKLTGGSSPHADRFGYAVAIEYPYAIIGDPEDVKGGSGSAYVFVREGTNWSAQTRLSGTDGEAMDEFGAAIAIDGDRAVVGAPGQSPREPFSHMGGVGYVFLRTGAGWEQAAMLRAAEPEDIDIPLYGAGTSVSISGNSLVLGAPGAHGPSVNGETRTGAAYLYTGAGGKWEGVEKLVPGDGMEGNPFGCAVSIHAGLIIVGNYQNNPLGHESGAAYAFGLSSLERRPVELPEIAVEPLEHQFFIDDKGEFELTISHVGGGPVDVELTLNLLPDTPPGNPPRLPDDTPTEFIEDLETEAFSLSPQEKKVFNVNVADLLPMIKHFERDILFGANVQIKAWPSGDSETLIFDDEFNIYRYLDVADDDHDDGIVAMARTLADGPDGVVRIRPLDLHIHENAAVELRVADPTDFAISSGPYPAAFVFNPRMRTKRDPDPPSTVVFLDTEQDESIGSIVIQGIAEPRNNIYFNESGFTATLREIITLARNDVNAGENPHDYSVHPALITADELTAFDTGPKRKDLAQKVKHRIQEELWGTLMEGIEWEKDVNQDNTIRINWSLRSNRHKKKPYALGVSTPDNKPGIKAIIEDKDTWNRAELSFRLAEAINPNSSTENIEVYLDSILEFHKGFGDNKLTLTQEQMKNAFAKTAVHEIAHTMSLRHSAQLGVREAKGGEFQELLVILDPYSDSTSFKLSLHRIETAEITLSHDDPIAWKMRIFNPLLAARSIGIKNFPETDTAAYGVTICKCSVVQEGRDTNALSLTKEHCNGVPVAQAGRTFILQFESHLEGADIELVKIDPSFQGSVQELKKGETQLTLKNKAGVLLRANLPNAEKDIMFGGFNDIEGILRFRPGVSLEVLKMALALDYTEEDVETVIKVYEAVFERDDKIEGADL